MPAAPPLWSAGRKRPSPDWPNLLCEHRVKRTKITNWTVSQSPCHWQMVSWQLY